jgi:hypothetical protein
VNKVSRFLGAFGISLLLLNLAFAQDFRGTITGRVMDASKASIPNATVTVKNTATNETFTATTDNEGNYKVPFLRPGDYTISVEASGFKKAERQNYTVAISQVAAVDFALEAGQITDTVTIEASGQVALESANADRGGVIDRQKVVELPLNARNPFMLGVLTAGVNFYGASIWQRPFDNGAIAEWTINGSQTRGNEFLLDGAPNNGQAGGNNIAYVPPVDSVQEFKIMTNTYDAQYGKTTGGIINVNLKSGTNAFHGSVYEFMRREWLDATDFRLKANGRCDPVNGCKPKHWLDQYGFQVEGPVRIPWLYNGKDKTFFMFNYEGYREGVPSPLRLSVPEPEMLQGDFSKLVDGAGRPIIIYDPLTGRADATAPGGWRRDPFPGNKIPAARINPIAQKILGFQPKPNAKDPLAGYARSNHLLPGVLATDSFFNYVVKVDQQFNERHRMYVRWAQNDRTEDRNVNGIFSGPGQDGQQPFKRINDAFVVDHLANFTPTFIFNFRVSFNRFIEDGFGAGNLDFDKTTLGFPSSLVNQVAGVKSFGRYTFSDYNTLGRFRGNNLTNTIATHPNFTWIRGAQTWRGGVDIRFTQFITKNEGSPFLITGTRGFTQSRFDQGDPNSGDSIASFLLGYVGGQADVPLFPTTLGVYYAPWFQNDWKVNRNFTLNLGLRWDINRAPNERYNRLNRGFDAGVTSPADSLINRTTFPTVPKLLGGLNFAGVNGIPEIAANTDWNNIQPRVGFAYQLRDKLVMRGGWGLYFVNPNNDYLQFNGFSISTPVITSNDGGRTPVGNILSNPFPGGITVPQGAAGGLSTFLGRGFNFVNTNFQVPYVHTFSLGFQYQLPGDSRLEVSYVGNRTMKLQTTRPFNEPDLAFRKRCNPLEGGNPVFCNEQLPNPFRGLAPFAGTNHFTATGLSRFQLARPYPHFAAFTEVTRNDGRINYDSLQATFEKRARNGLNGVFTYTFSKQIEEWGFNDVQQNIKQRGLYLADRPHRFTAGLVYQLPFGEGQKLLSGRGGFLSRIISGWQSSLIMQWQSGRPWDLNGNIMWINPDAYNKDINWKGSDQVWAFRTYAVNGSTTGARGVCAARMLDNGTLQLQSYSQNLQGCSLANVDMIRNPNYAPRFTSFRSSTVRLHSPPSADLSFNKMTKITEKIGLQLRVELFNFTNTYSYGVLHFTNDPDNNNFGSLFPRNGGNTQVAYPRHIQLAAKIIF